MSTTPKQDTDATSVATPRTGSVSSLDGYKAAGIEIKAMLEHATKHLPKRITLKMQKKAGYRAGYHAGLFMAWCMHVYGERPDMNEDDIKRILSRNNQGQQRGLTD